MTCAQAQHSVSAILIFITVYILLTFPTECDVGMIQCPNTTVCMNSTLACDGNIDCPDGIDESVNACGKDQTNLVY